MVGFSNRRAQNMLQFNKQRARALLAMVMNEYEARKGIYAYWHHSNPNAAVQERFFPAGMRRNSRKNGARLFVVNSQDTMSVSEVVHKRCMQILDTRQRKLIDGSYASHLFDARARNLSVAQVRAIFRQLGVSFPNSRLRYFPRMVETFFGEPFRGDVRRIYGGEFGGSITGVYRTCKKHNLIPGYGTKLLSLLMLYLQQFGFVDDLFDDAMPIDRHVQRMFVQSGVIEWSARVDAAKAERLLREELPSLIREMGYSVFDVSHALWFRGAKLCRDCEGHILSGNEDLLRLLCPVWERCPGGLCKGGVSTRSYHAQRVWTSGQKDRGDPRQLSLLDEDIE
jgi:hypothetical protein